eukprot:2576081-Pyramimonas_sp.AAC.1
MVISPGTNPRIQDLPLSHGAPASGQRAGARFKCYSISSPLLAQVDPAVSDMDWGAQRQEHERREQAKRDAGNQ